MNISPQIAEQISKHLSCAGGNAGRLFHGRGQCFPGYDFVTIDRLADQLLVACFDSSEAQQCRQLAETLVNHKLTSNFQIWFQDRSAVSKKLENISYPSKSAKQDTEITENGLKYIVKLGDNQNIGFFFDSANLRQDLLSNARGKKILNLFSYTCSYSIAAIAGGATSVVNIDISKPSLNWGRDNHRINNLPTKSVVFKSYDVMKSLTTISRMGPFDWVIIDPPTNQGKAFNANRDYHKIIRRLDPMIASGGKVTACLNDPLESEAFLVKRFTDYSLMNYCYRTLPTEVFKNLNPAEGLKILNFSKD